MMRIFTAALSTETNTFAPWPTGRAGFVVVEPADAGGVDDTDGFIMRDLRERAERDGHELVVSLMASAEPSGPTLQPVYEAFRDRIVADFRDKGPFDVTLLFLHGAMVSTACDDCEGDLIAHLRRAGGPDLVIGVELDPHCHLTDAMVDRANAIVLMKEYPHTDFVERAWELYGLCTDTRAGRIDPVSAVFDCRMVGFYPTTTEPMLGLLCRIRAEEARAGVLSVSFVHGFPWGDMAEAGSKVLVIADRDAALAAETAERVGRMIYAEREALLPRMPDVARALDLCAEASGLVVLADTADNAGGGAPSDNVALLRALIARGVRDAAFGCVWDPMVVDLCRQFGVGARFGVRLGGKCGPASGEPIDLEVTVRAIAEAHDQEGLGRSRAPLGAAAWIEAAGVDIVVNTIRSQTISPDAFTGLGIDLSSKRLVAVKSSQHFQANFAALADSIILAATPGALQMDFAALAYRRKRDLEFFPRVADPLGQAVSGTGWDT